MIAKINKEIALEVLKKIDGAAKRCDFVTYPYAYNVIRVEGNIEKDKDYDSTSVADNADSATELLNIEDVFNSLTYGRTLFIDAFQLKDILDVSDEYEELDEGEFADYTLLYLDGSEHVINTDDSDGILLDFETYYTISFVPKGEEFELYIGMHSIDQGPGMWARGLITESGDTVKKLEGVAKGILGI